MPPNRFESEVESFLEGSHGDRTHIKRADHHTVTPLCGTLLSVAILLCLVREKVRPARLGVGVSAKKFARRTQNGPKSAFFGVLGELFRGEPEKAGCWESFVAVLWSCVFQAAR